jgi:hypothetical protein
VAAVAVLARAAVAAVAVPVVVMVAVVQVLLVVAQPPAVLEEVPELVALVVLKQAHLAVRPNFHMPVVAVAVAYSPVVVGLAVLKRITPAEVAVLVEVEVWAMLVVRTRAAAEVLMVLEGILLIVTVVAEVAAGAQLVVTVVVTGLAAVVAVMQ